MQGNRVKGQIKLGGWKPDSSTPKQRGKKLRTKLQDWTLNSKQDSSRVKTPDSCVPLLSLTCSPHVLPPLSLVVHQLRGNLSSAHDWHLCHPSSQRQSGIGSPWVGCDAMPRNLLVSYHPNNDWWGHLAYGPWHNAHQLVWGSFGGAYRGGSGRRVGLLCSRQGVDNCGVCYVYCVV